MTITDYESFMTGVITGIKLGRTSPGRQPPMPSGRYILTESGEKVLTEKLYSEIDTASVYSPNIWYRTNYKGDHPTADFVEMMVETDIPSQYLYQKVTINGTVSALARLLFSTEDLLGCRQIVHIHYVKYYSENDSMEWYETLDQSITTSYQLYQAGDIHYWTYFAGGSDTPLIPIGANAFTGTKDQLDVYLSGMNYRPLITEGG